MFNFFTITAKFNQFNTSLINKNMNFFKTNKQTYTLNLNNKLLETINLSKITWLDSVFVSALLLLVRAAAATSVCLVLRDGEGCRRGGVCPNAFRPLCWDSSWWYATGVIGCGNAKEGLRCEEGKK